MAIIEQPNWCTGVLHANQTWSVTLASFNRTCGSGGSLTGHPATRAWQEPRLPPTHAHIIEGRIIYVHYIWHFGPAGTDSVHFWTFLSLAEYLPGYHSNPYIVKPVCCEYCTPYSTTAQCFLSRTFCTEMSHILRKISLPLNSTYFGRDRNNQVAKVWNIF